MIFLCRIDYVMQFVSFFFNLKQLPYSMGMVAGKHDFGVQIRTFYAILAKKMFFFLTLPPYLECVVVAKCNVSLQIRIFHLVPSKSFFSNLTPPPGDWLANMTLLCQSHYYMQLISKKILYSTSTVSTLMGMVDSKNYFSVHIKIFLTICSKTVFLAGSPPWGGWLANMTSLCRLDHFM